MSIFKKLHLFNSQLTNPSPVIANKNQHMHQEAVYMDLSSMWLILSLVTDLSKTSINMYNLDETK